MSHFKILLIDDEEKIVQLLSEALIFDGHHVTGISDSLAALDYFWNNHQNYDVVVTDHLMPGILGSDIVVKIKEKHPDFPVILATGNSSDDIGQRLGDNFHCHFSVLQKPFHKQQLLERINKVIER